MAPRAAGPNLPFPYADEVWTGIEYQVAAHLIYEGWLDEGLRIVEAVRERHDGIRRNPWNEVECGNHYARSMSSWALLLALTGAHVDPATGDLSFAPVSQFLSKDESFRTLWSNGRALGHLQAIMGRRRGDMARVFRCARRRWRATRGSLRLVCRAITDLER